MIEPVLLTVEIPVQLTAYTDILHCQCGHDMTVHDSVLVIQELVNAKYGVISPRIRFTSCKDPYCYCTEFKNV